MSRLKVLLVGSLPPPLGGTTVLFHQLVNDLKKRDDISVIVINTADIRSRGARGFLRFFAVLWRILKETSHVDIMSIHVSPTAIPFLGTASLMIARLKGRPFILRMFGGKNYSELGFGSGKVTRWVASKADLFLVETKALLRSVLDDGVKRAEWYSNSRVIAEEVKAPATKCSRFVFISHVTPAKGIFEIISAVERFDNEIIADIYGPLCDGVSQDVFSGLKRVHYKGILQPDEVLATLGDYDAVLLPTHCDGEGYPGIILEAFSVGLPVICTRLGGLSEIVDDTVGLSIEPKNVDALYEAIKMLNEDNSLYAQLRGGARKKRGDFSSKLWTERFVIFCRELVRR